MDIKWRDKKPEIVSGLDAILAAISNAMDTVNFEYSTLVMNDDTYRNIMRKLNNAYATTLREMQNASS